MLYYNYTFPRELKTLLCSLFYSITIFKKTNVHKIFTKKELYPIFLVDMGSLSPSYLLKSPSFDGKMMEIFLS
jgi:hypothetical protein